MSLGNEWQTVQAALAGLDASSRCWHSRLRRTAPGDPSPAAIQEHRHHRDAGGVLWLPVRPPVLRGVSLAAQPGEHVVLVGRTGAGKSSVLHLLGEFCPMKRDRPRWLALTLLC